MAYKYDLHSHSTASDGTLPPEALIARAHAKGVEVLALTDHDTLDGLEAAQIAAMESGLTFSPGVEVSVDWGGRTIHVVGLGIDYTNESLKDGLARQLTCRRSRAEEMGRRLAKAGIRNAYEGARSLSGGRVVGRTHFARFLVKAGYAASEREAFKGYLLRGRPGHVAGDWAKLDEAISWIRSAGGQAVIAHPARYRFTHAKLIRLINAFKEAGGVGIEVIAGSHTRDECFVFARHAQDHGLLASAGSDFHGPECAWIELGGLPPMPRVCTPVWADWALPFPSGRIRLPLDTPHAGRSRPTIPNTSQGRGAS